MDFTYKQAPPNAHEELSSKEKHGLRAVGLERFPVMIARAGQKAALRFVEFFTANIRNRNTRRAYVQAVGQFFAMPAPEQEIVPTINRSAVSRPGLNMLNIKQCIYLSFTITAVHS